MRRRTTPSPQPKPWWRFIDQEPGAPASGTFRASRTEHRDRLYFPLVNEAGMLSWTSPSLQGSPAVSHHEYLAPPLTAEDLPHVLVHRDFWVVEPEREPFSVSGLSPRGLLEHLASPARNARSQIEAGPGWFSLTRVGPARRFSVRVTLWCPADLDEAIELMQIEVTNTSSRRLAFHPYAALPLYARSADNIRDHRHVTVLLHRVTILPYGVSVCPTMSFDERGHRPNTTRYAALALGPRGDPPTDIWAVQDQFLGPGGNFAAPEAVWKRLAAPTPPSSHQIGREAIGGFRWPATRLAPGATATYLLIGGIARNPDSATRWVRWAKRPNARARSLVLTKTFWQAKIHRVSFHTPDRALDHWLTWVTFQPLLRRRYGNSFLPQFDYGRGGRGWRDLWQDCLALLLSDPTPVRPMLLHNLGGVRIDGSNATIIGTEGRFIADRNRIPRTWMDHGAWPTYTTLLYIDQTGDVNILFEEREYFRDPQIFRCRRQDPTWTSTSGSSLRRDDHRVYRGSVLEHLLVQHLTAFFNVGGHNISRLEGADWNDGLDMAARRGESVAFSAFYAWNLRRLADIIGVLKSRGITTIRLARELGLLLDRLPGHSAVNYRSVAAKRRRLEQYLATVARRISGRMVAVPVEALQRDLLAKYTDLAARIRQQEWLTTPDGSFFNGYYDNAGRRVEGRHARRMRMTLTGQVFPVMSGIATEEQVEHVIDSVNRWLRDPASGGIRLNTDFGGVQPALGRAFSFAYGEKENGAVFSHMAVLYACALYARRHPDVGRRVWHALYRLATNQRTAGIFPCLPEYFNQDGRGMYCYLTGSASWLVYLLLTQAVGVRGELGDLVIDPQLTPEDFAHRRSVAVRCSFAGRPLKISVENAQRLRPGTYAVGELWKETEPLPFTRRPQGGVYVKRRLITQCPRSTETLLRVVLHPRQDRGGWRTFLF